jgi:hypothetical protein
MFKSYDLIINKILTDANPQTDWRQVLEHHQTMLARIQHERLIHLLVTIFVGLVMSIASFSTIVTKEAGLMGISIPLIILFICYLFHYRFLENTTQGWYILEDKIQTHC